MLLRKGCRPLTPRGIGAGRRGPSVLRMLDLLAQAEAPAAGALSLRELVTVVTIAATVLVAVVSGMWTPLNRQLDKLDGRLGGRKA